LTLSDATEKSEQFAERSMAHIKRLTETHSADEIYDEILCIWHRGWQRKRLFVCFSRSLPMGNCSKL